MRQMEARLLRIRPFGSLYFLHTYEAKQIAQEAQPGQFVHIRVGQGPHPILRRPFSICDAHRDTIDVLFKVVGEGTNLLASSRTGDLIDLIGPIGNPFTIEPRPSLLIAGGMGCAPLFFLARRLKESGHEVFFLYGARTANDLVMKEEIVALVDQALFVTEDGSLGRRGLATDFFDQSLTQGCALYACGPAAMFAALQNKLRALSRTAQFSLENRMACGVGACQGCSIETIDGYKRVCVDGPVFASDTILHLPNQEEIYG